MKVDMDNDQVTLWASATDTEEWAMGFRSGRRWPTSVLSGQRMRCSFDSGGLNDMTVGGRGKIDIPADEFNAFVVDALRNVLPTSHACYFVVVGQFITHPNDQ